MSLGLGSVIVSVVEVAPWLTAISRHRAQVFFGVGALLVFNYWMAVERPRRTVCPPGELCWIESPAMRANRALFWLSAAIYAAALAVLAIAVLWVRVQP